MCIRDSAIWTAATQETESLDEAAIARRAPQPAKYRITQVAHDESACASCGACEMVCALAHAESTGPTHQRIWLDRRPFQGIYFANSCLQCDGPECYYSCLLYTS